MTEKINQNSDIVRYAFLDLSSSSTGYAIAKHNFEEGIGEIYQAGIIRWNKDINLSTKLNNMFHWVADYLYMGHVSVLVMERFSFNPKMCMGAVVVPYIIGACLAGSVEMMPPLDSNLVVPGTWKKAVIGNGRAKKPEIEAKIREIFPNIPEKMKNPPTGKDIKVPSDLFDALGIALYYLKERVGCTGVTLTAEIQ